MLARDVSFDRCEQAVDVIPEEIREQEEKPRVEGVPESGPFTIMAPTDAAFDQMLRVR